MSNEEFAKRIENVREKLYKTAMLYLGSHSQAGDALDEAIYKALCSCKKLRQPEFFDTWITRIVINECNNELRRRKRTCPMEELPETAVEEFDFLLEFDPTYTAAGQIITLNQTLELDGQEITITEAEIYPTHMRITITDAEENTAWMQNLRFYMETEDGTRFGDSVGFFGGFGDLKTEERVIYYAESPYFYDAKELKLVIEGAEFLDKEFEKVRVDLKNETADHLPAGMALEEIRNEGEMIVVRFSHLLKETEQLQSQLFDMVYYDKVGTEYSMSSSSFGRETRKNGEHYKMQELFLENYPYDEVWFGPRVSHTWTAEEEIVVKIK